MPAPLKDAGDLRGAAGLAVLQPSPGHHAAVAEQVERGVIQLRHRLEAEHDHRHAHPLHHGQDRGRKGVSGDVEEDQPDVLTPKEVRGLDRFRRAINQPCIDHGHAHVAQACRDRGLVTAQPVSQPLELGPVGLQSDTEKPDARRRSRVHGTIPCTRRSLRQGTR